VLLIAVGVDVWNKKQGRPSLFGFMTRNRKTAEFPDEAPMVVPDTGTPDTARPNMPT